MRKIIKIIVLILFCFYSLFFFVGSTLAPILAHFKFYDQSAIWTATYMYSCHQQPNKSFWIMGYPIALCCRCYGFYLGVTFSTIIALFTKFQIKLKIFLILLTCVTIDIVLNYYFNINTGNILRFVIGIIMGILFTSVVCYIVGFKKENKFYDN